MKYPSHQSGVALLAVLWITAFLAAIASTVAHQSRTSLQVTKNRIDMMQLGQIAESAVLLRIVDQINSPQLPSTSVETALLPALPDGINVNLSIHDESGKVDLNSAPQAVLVSLMIEVGLDEDTAINVSNSILDWRDEDELTRVNGAEDIEYQKSGYQYGSKDADFERIEELQLVKGVSAELFAAISPHVTVYAQDFGVNVSAASNLVQQVVSNAAILESDLAEDEALLDSEEAFTSLSGGVVFNIRASVSTKSGVSQNLSTVIRIERGNIYEPFTVLKWLQE
ncbi:MAG: general secretion pathway protein GspK [Gammaproteobacteria bacterium]